MTTTTKVKSKGTKNPLKAKKGKDPSPRSAKVEGATNVKRNGNGNKKRNGNGNVKRNGNGKKK